MVAERNERRLRCRSPGREADASECVDMSEISDMMVTMASSPTASVDVFVALANPVRRRLLELLNEGERNAGALASQFELSRPAVSEHLQLLRRAHLVHEEVRGRQHFYRLEPTPLADVGSWLQPFEHYWRTQLANLATFLEQEPNP